MTISDRATRLTAKVAPYRDAIARARELGLTWADLCKILGIDASPDRLRTAVRLSVRYGAEQIPLPDPKPETPPPAPTAAVAGDKVTPGPRPIGQPSNKDFLASLPQIGSKK